MASTAGENQRTPRVFISYSHDTRSIAIASSRSRRGFEPMASTRSSINLKIHLRKAGRFGAPGRFSIPIMS